MKLIAILAVVLFVSAEHVWAADAVKTNRPMVEGFVHPGIYHTSNDLAFMRQKIQSRSEPWYGAWQQLQSEGHARLTFTPHAVAEWDANKDPYPGGDALAAYSHALQWALTGNPAHAAKAIEILNAWSSNLKHIHGNNSQEMLVWGWNGCHFVNAAELLRFYVPPGGKPSSWAPVEVERFKKMLGMGYETIKDFKPAFNGNWDAALMNTMLCTAIFTDDPAMFDRVIDHFNGKYQLANPRQSKNGNLTSYLLSTGQCQESGRDQGHVQMGLGNYSALCEAAWKQGVDLYGAFNNRLLVGYEYTAKYMLGHDDVSFAMIPGVQWTKISAEKRDHFVPIYEAVYQHYVYRKGLEMPFTRQIIYSHSAVLATRRTVRSYRPETSTPNAGICWGTLTMYKGVEDPQVSLR
ncbi:MAG: alginate lyase family protein [Verrucomicrobiota bacterium]